MRKWLTVARIATLEKVIFTIVFSLMVTSVGALTLMLSLEFLNNFYQESVPGLSYIACFIIVLALRGLYWSVSTDTSEWFDKAKAEL
jgi:hypothetical protein